MDAPTVMRETNPLALFNAWLAEARAAMGDAATQMVLSTADEAGAPWSRVVLLKAVDARGFVFCTNLDSAKSRQLKANPHAALCFNWMAIHKQVCIQGLAEPLSDFEADVFFEVRKRESQIAAWASHQSQPLSDRRELEDRYAQHKRQFEGKLVPRPPFWSGYRIMPKRMEFWSERSHRLHERIVYTRTPAAWQSQMLYP